MSRRIKLAIAVMLCALSSHGRSAEEKRTYIDYTKLDHDVVVKEFRAGNHDKNGVNNYYFKAVLFAVKKDPDEKKLGLEKRTSLKKAYDTFGEFVIPVLTTWTGEPKLELRIAGEDLRILTSEAMQTWKLPEEKVALQMEVVLYEKEKRFWFFGDDRAIGKMRYYIIPETSPHTAPREDRDLVLTDEWGTLLVLSVKYKPDEAQKTAAATQK